MQYSMNRVLFQMQPTLLQHLSLILLKVFSPWLSNRLVVFNLNSWALLLLVWVIAGGIGDGSWLENVILSPALICSGNSPFLIDLRSNNRRNDCPPPPTYVMQPIYFWLGLTHKLGYSTIIVSTVCFNES